MDADAYRDLQLLNEISSGDSVTQRGLAQKFGLALGMINFLLRRLVKKGYVKIVNLQRNRLRYLLTPKGIAEKAQLTSQYLDYSLALYRHIHALITRTLSVLLQSGGKNTVLYGIGELSEIAFLFMRQRGLNVAAVIDESVPEGTLFMDQPVKGPAALRSLSYDWVVVASFKDHSRITQLLCRWGVPPDKIVTITDREQTAPQPGRIIAGPEPLLKEPSLR